MTVIEIVSASAGTGKTFHITQVLNHRAHRRNQLFLSGTTNHKIFFAGNK